MELTTLLEQFNFSPLEARIYLATLELGQAPASQIARKIDENRVSVYSCLQALMKKGVILTVVKNKVVHYSAISPKNLLTTAQQKIESLSEKMPELLALSNTFGNRPSMQLYEGLEGLKMVYEDMLSYPESTMKMFLWYSKGISPSVRRHINTVFLPTRVKRKIFAQILFPLSEKEKSGYEVLFLHPSQQQAEIRFVSEVHFLLKDTIHLYGGNKIAILMLSEEEMIGIIIKSDTLYTTLSALFDLTRNRETEIKREGKEKKKKKAEK